jgi:hypothetical protein
MFYLEITNNLFLILRKYCNRKEKPVKIFGNIAKNRKILPIMFPSNKDIKERWKPPIGQ